MSKISPCLWFDGEAEDAAKFYVSLLPDSRVAQQPVADFDGHAQRACNADDLVFDKDGLADASLCVGRVGWDFSNKQKCQSEENILTPIHLTTVHRLVVPCAAADVVVLPQATCYDSTD